MNNWLDMSGTDGSSATDSIRARLAGHRPAFTAAVDLEAQVERFCRDIRQQLRYWRKLMGLEQTAVATALEIGQSAVSKLENGDGDIGVKTLFRYARALGLDLRVSFASPEAGTPSEPQNAVADVAMALQQAIHHQLLMLDNLQSTAAKLSEVRRETSPPLDTVISE